MAKADELDIVTADANTRIFEHFHTPYAVVEVGTPGIFVALGVVDKGGLEVTEAGAYVDRAPARPALLVAAE